MFTWLYPTPKHTDNDIHMKFGTHHNMLLHYTLKKYPEDRKSTKPVKSQGFPRIFAISAYFVLNVTFLSIQNTVNTIFALH